MMQLTTWIRGGSAVVLMAALSAGCTDRGPATDDAEAAATNLTNGTAREVVRNAYEVNRLVSDDPAAAPARLTDPLLKNAWGLAAGPDTFWWVADNATGAATLYDAEGNKQALEVKVPGAPTGEVYSGGMGFQVSCSSSGPARFIFASEDGTLSAWSPAVPEPAPSREAFVMVDNSSMGAIYKGLAIATTATGDRLYATDFHNGKVDVFDESWRPVRLGRGAFKDARIPDGYAPFGIRAINKKILVTYALQDEDAEDDVRGQGHGFVDAYDVDGKLLMRVASRGRLDSPWGLAMAPDEFGKFGGMLLIGNFGDGRINAYDLSRCTVRGCMGVGSLRDENRGAIVIDGLWAIDFAKGNEMTGEDDELYFTAGPNDESNGLFGYIEVADDTELSMTAK